MRHSCLLFALALFAAAGPTAAARGDAPFVVTYRCDGDRWLVVGYPAFQDARREPIRLTWNGRTVLLGPARAGSGARYVNARANLEWWSTGTGGTLSRLLPSVRPLLTNCVEA